MKKIISLILVLVMCLAVFPFSAVAAEEEIDLIKDMFEFDFELTDEQFLYYLEDCEYMPKKGESPYGWGLQIYAKVYPDDRFYNPYFSGDGFETSAQILDYFHDWCEIKREYFDKYLTFDPTYFELAKRDGKYISMCYIIIISDELIEITDTYSSYERAYFYAKLYYALTGTHRYETNYWMWNCPKNYYYFIDDYRDHVYKDPEVSEYWDEILPFDANFDGSINARDLMILRKMMLGEDVKCNYYTKDLSGDGVTNAKDVLYLKKFVMTGEDMRNK